jgi:hypothetical protein
VIPRVLTNIPKLDIHLLKFSPPFYLDADGKLNMSKLMTSWKEFYLKNIEFWTNRGEFEEAGVHLLLFAFLQRVVNGGGIIDREYALGKKECDIHLRKPYKNGTFASGPIQNEAIELKVYRKSNKSALNTFVTKATEQLVNNYCKRPQITHGYLLVVDQHSDAPLASRMREETVEKDGCTVYIYYL